MTLQSQRCLLSISVTCWVAITSKRSFSFFFRLHSSHQLEKSLRYFFNSLKAELRDNMKVHAYEIDQNYAYKISNLKSHGEVCEKFAASVKQGVCCVNFHLHQRMKRCKYLLHQRIKFIRFPDVVGLAPCR
ncbi:hypothetical protein V8G54_031023 [Vigna mungo]|uniref:Uncharacterized protein n=1 Tax=Vigna mungo TaxID=3915 RepID=A0AAQ3MXJ9_VIGMU